MVSTFGRRALFASRALAATVAVLLLFLLGACSGGDTPETLGEETIVGDVTGVATPDVAESFDERESTPEDGERAMFDELDALINPQVPDLSGRVDRPPLGPDDRVVFGGIATETIDGQPALPWVCLGAEARLAGAAVRGELSREIEWLGCSDDAGFSDRTDNALNRLRFRQPFAVVPLLSQRFFAEDLLNEEFVPYIGLGSQPAFCDVSNSFGFAVTGAVGCPVLDVIGYTTAAPVLQAWLDAVGLAAEDQRVVVVVDGSVSGAERARSRALEVERIGAELVLVDDTLSAGGASSAADLDRVAQAVARIEPDVVVVEIDGADALYPRLRAAGVQGNILGVGVDPALLHNDGDLRARFADTWQVVAGLSVQPDSGIFDEDAARLDVSPSQIGQGYVSGYASMDFFLQALEATVREAASPTGVSAVGAVEFRDVVNDGWSYPGIPGVVCGSDWPTSHLQSVPCASVVRLDEAGEAREVLPPTSYPLLIEVHE